MRPRLLSLLSALPLGVAALGLVPTASSAAMPSTKVLTTAVLPNLTAATDLGPVAPSTPVRVGVAIAHRDTAGEEAYVRGLYDATSPLYHRYLTPAAYAQRFGVPDATFAPVLADLTHHGLRPIYTSATHDYVLLSGTAQQVDATFQTAEHRFRFADGSVLRATAVAPRVDGVVSAVLGLDSLQRLHFNHTAPQQDLCIQGTCTGALTPQDLWSVYHQPAGDLGDGQKVAIFGEGQVFDGLPPTGSPGNDVIDNLRLFEDAYGLPHVNVRTTLAADTQTATDGTEEWDIDSQAVNGMAPNLAELDYYFGNSLADADMVPAFEAWANDASGPLQGNFSVGGCESLNYALGAIAAEGPIYRQLAAEGRTLFVSTGDTGGSCTVGGPVNINGVGNTGAPQVEWPASSPYVVAVGGTVLYTDGGTPAKRTQEYAWTHTGGGSSIMEPAPAWQQRLAASAPAALYGRCAVNDDGSPAAPNTLCRGLPDVSALSGDVLTNGYTIVDPQTPQGGGTSLASPLWAGMWARVQAAAPAVNGNLVGLGFAAPRLYDASISPAADQRDFYDVTLGSNGQYAAQARNATLDPTGWDYVSGLGVPDVTNLATDVAGSTVPVAPGLPPSQPDQVTQPTVVCPPAGTMTDPSGDAIGAFAFYPSETGVAVSASDPATDLVSGAIAYDATAGVLTWTDVVKQLDYPSSAAREGSELEDQFTIGSATYELRAARDVSGSLTFELGTWDPVNFIETDLVALSGSFDPSTNSVRVVLPGDVFAHATGVTLGTGTTLTNLTVLGDAYVNESQNSFTGADSMDQMVASCGFTLS